MVSIHSIITPVLSLALVPALQTWGTGNPNVNRPVVGETTALDPDLPQAGST